MELVAPGGVVLNLRLKIQTSSAKNKSLLLILCWLFRTMIGNCLGIDLVAPCQFAFNLRFKILCWLYIYIEH